MDDKGGELTGLVLHFDTGAPQEVIFDAAALTDTAREIDVGSFDGPAVGPGPRWWVVEVENPRSVDADFALDVALFGADTVTVEMFVEDGRHLRGRAIPDKPAGSTSLRLKGAGGLEEA